MTLLENCSSPDGPANQTFRSIENIVHFRLREFVDWSRQISEVQRLNGLYAQGHFIDDSAKTIARPDRVQQVRVSCLGSLGKVPGRGDPLDLGDVRTHLAEFDTVESVFAVAAGGRTERHVADFNVQHELKAMIPQSSGSVDDLQAGLSGERQIRVVDRDDLGHARHVDDGAVG